MSEQIHPELQAAWAALRDSERAAVCELGERIGYGNMMHLASEVWRERADHKGSEFRVGPCAALTVPCGCREAGESACDWCMGAGWLTTKVREVQRGDSLDRRAFGLMMAGRRKAAKLTLREVAAHMGKSVGYVSDLEHGRKAWGKAITEAYDLAVMVLQASRASEQKG